MRRSRGTRAAVAAALTTALAVALLAALPLGAHIERDPYFVDPAPDTSIVPATGGEYVAARKLTMPAKRLKSFRRLAKRVIRRRTLDDRRREQLTGRFVRLSKRQQGKAIRTLRKLSRGRALASADALGLTDPRVQAEETLVVCRPDSLSRLRTSLTQVRLSTSARRDRRLKRALLLRNRAYMRMCRFDEIQEAVFGADNNDTILVMPGFYTEPTARSKPHNDPACSQFVSQGSRSAPAPTYEYHFKCPNDLNAIAILGRELQPDDKPGPCIRCNLHIVGTGAKPEDVIVDGAKDPVDPGVSTDLFEEGRGQVEGAKEVGFRVERADGAYIGNLTVQNFTEHGFYSIEADGVTFDRVKAYWNHEYGHLAFATDHVLVQDGDFAGSSDAGIYPGASPPSAPRMNTIIRRNVAHHNAIGLSGSMGSGLHIVDNEFTQNSTGITLDSISRAGHPGYPQRGTLIERNRIHANNFDTYAEDAWVESSTPSPIGVGVLFGGGNDNVADRNWIYDNWRWGIGLLSVPDIVTEQDSPDDLRLSNSHRNRQIGNFMGVAPDGARLPNGTDFWWDELGEGNCWERNGEVTSDPANLPDCETFPNIGRGNAYKEAMLVDCAVLGERGDPGKPLCDWYRMPEKP